MAQSEDANSSWNHRACAGWDFILITTLPVRGTIDTKSIITFMTSLGWSLAKRN